MFEVVILQIKKVSHFKFDSINLHQMVALVPEQSSAPTCAEVSTCSLDLVQKLLDQLVGRH